jgi:hypothetical protein
LYVGMPYYRSKQANDAWTRVKTSMDTKKQSSISTKRKWKYDQNVFYERFVKRNAAFTGDSKIEVGYKKSRFRRCSSLKIMLIINLFLTSVVIYTRVVSSTIVCICLTKNCKLLANIVQGGCIYFKWVILALIAAKLFKLIVTLQTSTLTTTC